MTAVEPDQHLHKRQMTPLNWFYLVAIDCNQQSYRTVVCLCLCITCCLRYTSPLQSSALCFSFSLSASAAAALAGEVGVS